jgi:hypothetical protein
MKLGYGELKAVGGTGENKESAHMACLTNPVSHPSFNVPLISNDVTNSERQVSAGFSLECSVFTPQMALTMRTNLVPLIMHSLLYTWVSCARFVA